MTNDELMKTAADLLAPWTKSSRTPEANRLDVHINGADLLPAVKALLDAHWGYLVAITALDYLGKPNPFAQDERFKQLVDAGALTADAAVFELLYFFSAGPVMCALRMIAPRTATQIDSVCGLISSASFFERELSEMFGVKVLGTPNTDRLFLPDEWPYDVYPLRKDFVPNTAQPTTETGKS